MKIIFSFIVISALISCRYITPEHKEKINEITSDINEGLSKLRQNLIDNFEKFVKKNSLSSLVEKSIYDKKYKFKKVSNLEYVDDLATYFPDEIINNAEYVKVKEIPSILIAKDIGINEEMLEKANLDPEMLSFDQINAITFGNKIIIRDDLAKHEKATFFHELVHVVQYDYLGNENFLKQYLKQVLNGIPYEEILAEVMAFKSEKKFLNNDLKIDKNVITDYVQKYMKK